MSENKSMKFYQAKSKKLSGTDFHEVHDQAFDLYKKIKKRSKRRPYLRSVYFNKEKVFLDYFWQHIFGYPNWRDRTRRLKYYPCAIELIQKSCVEPSSKENPNNHSEILHRFAGATKDKDIFFVQIKENKKTSQKFFISVFPLNK